MSILDKKTDTNKNNFFSKIPGFRSDNPLMKKVAWAYYIFVIIGFLGSIGEGYLMVFALALITIPFVAAGVKDVIKERTYRNREALLKKVVAPFIAMVVLLTASLSSPGLVTDEVTQVTDENISESEGISSGDIQDSVSTPHADVNALQTPSTDQALQGESSVDGTNNMVSSQVVETKEAEIHFIDTGNSDAILIKQGEHAALIDGGDNNDEERVVSYLQSQGITQLDYLFATHPHADHIGGLDAVVEHIAIKNIYVGNGDMDTATYSDFITAMTNKGLSPSVPLLDSEFKLGTSTFKVLSVANGTDPNNNSLVLLYTNGEDKVLFMGDAEAEIEGQINPGDVDLLKVGHHGSHSSSTASFINKVSPEYAVILAGEDNKYGHPHAETMATLKAHNIEVHRTDECGNIVFKSTGNGLVVECKEGSYQSGESTSSSSSSSSSNSTTSSSSSSSSSNSTTSSSSSSSSSSSTTSGGSSASSGSGHMVYANGGSSTSNKYHSSPTAHNMEGAIQMTQSEAEAKGYVACKRCY